MRWHSRPAGVQLSAFRACAAPVLRPCSRRARRAPSQGWGENDRGVSYTFGPDVVTEFLQKHDLDLICRAHQVRGAPERLGPIAASAQRRGTLRLAQHGAPPLAAALHTLPPQTPFSCWQVVEEGYEFFAKRQLVTIFSAPNYCGEFENAGAMMSVDDTLMCSFQVRAGQAYTRVWGGQRKQRSVACCGGTRWPLIHVPGCPPQSLKPAEKKQKAVYGGY